MAYFQVYPAMNHSGGAAEIVFLSNVAASITFKSKSCFFSSVFQFVVLGFTTDAASL